MDESSQGEEPGNGRAGEWNGHSRRIDSFSLIMDRNAQCEEEGKARRRCKRERREEEKEGEGETTVVTSTHTLVFQRA